MVLRTCELTFVPISSDEITLASANRRKLLVLALVELSMTSLALMRLVMFWSDAFDQSASQPGPVNIGSSVLLMKSCICAGVNWLMSVRLLADM
ncbi:hypothetical protein D3C72_1615300 [compost metagenome]